MQLTSSTRIRRHRNNGRTYAVAAALSAVPRKHPVSFHNSDCLYTFGSYVMDFIQLVSQNAFLCARACVRAVRFHTYFARKTRWRTQVLIPALFGNQQTQSPQRSRDAGGRRRRRRPSVHSALLQILISLICCRSLAPTDRTTGPAAQLHSNASSREFACVYSVH